MFYNNKVCALYFIISTSTHQDSIEDCQPCLPGDYCDGRGATEPSGTCKAGHICFGSAVISDPKYNADASDNKTLILFGDLCVAGFYCPAGTAVMIACPKGTYNSDLGKASLSDCLLCDPGQYCAETNLTAPTGNLFIWMFCLAK